MKKHIQTLYCVLICCMASTPFLSAQVQETFTICPGESVFLAAIQIFPAPPQGPAGPDGGLPITPCTPQLSSTNISPLTSISSGTLGGFTVSPTTSTIYTLTSSGVCGGPGSDNSDEQSVTYEVIVGACLPTVQQTFTICAGESVLLPAIQTFPTPPSPPQGPGGGIPITPCTPQLSDISIAPTANSDVSSMAGFTVSPNMTTIYTVSSNGFCGAPGVGVNRDQINFVYEVIVQDCDPLTSIVQQTLTICAGESVLLPAIQTFPSPPQGPVGSDTPCTPQLSETRISPIANATPSALAGFNVSPTTTTIYTVTSNGFCSAPGIPPNSDEINFVYEVIVEGICATPTMTNTIINNYPWLHSIIDPNNCTGMSVIVYQNNKTNYLLVTDGSGIQTLYLETGSFHCQSADNYDCVAIYGLTEIIGRWSCGDGAAACTSNDGVFFFTDCSDELFYFLELVGGIIVDPYFAEGITFEPQEGQLVQFDYVEANFATPCTVAEKAITITCITPISDAGTTSEIEIDASTIEAVETDPTNLFQQYPWLTSLINLANCSGETVDIYHETGHNYLLVTNRAGLKVLYYENGTLYCESTATYDCVEVYGFVEFVGSWSCDSSNMTDSGNTTDSNSSENPLFTTYTWLNNLINTNNCTTESIKVYENAGNIYLLIESNGEQNLYFRDGTFYCKTQPNYDCLAAYKLSAPIITWTCGDQIISPTPLPDALIIGNSVVSLQVFPNPTSGEFIVQTTTSSQDQQLRLYDLQGRIMETRFIAAHDFTDRIAFDLSSAPAGIYYLEWQSGNEQTIQKVMKQAF